MISILIIAGCACVGIPSTGMAAMVPKKGLVVVPGSVLTVLPDNFGWQQLLKIDSTLVQGSAASCL